MSELKPCPFCGGETELIHDEYVNGWTIVCKKRCIRICHYESKQKLIEKWNTRASDAENYRYHVDCDDFNHECDSCKHGENCTYNCSACNANSAVCFYERDDTASPTLQDIYDLIESHDARLDYLIGYLKHTVGEWQDANEELDKLGVILTEMTKTEEAERE